jgi:glycosyltransferase involved in cell wall biosynthesis
MMPKVSVIVPAYNCETLISRTILSVCNQTFTDWELIVVDDGSTDGTRDVVLSFQNKDSRIKYVHQANSGAPARPKNTGLKEALGEYIAFLDHDDEWMPQKLERQLALFADSKMDNWGLVASDAIIIDEIDESQVEYKKPSSPRCTSALLEENFIVCSSGVVVKKEVFSKVGVFDENFRFGDDWDMWLRISLSFDFGFVHEPLFKFYRHPSSVMNKVRDAAIIRDYEYGLSKHLALYRQYPKQFSCRLVHIGQVCYLAGEKKKGISLFLKAIRADPLNGRGYAKLFLSLLGPYCYNLSVTSNRNRNRRRKQRLSKGVR